MLTATLTLPNGHTVTMVAQRNEWATSDTDDDAWRVVLDTDASALEGDAPGSYTPHN